MSLIRCLVFVTIINFMSNKLFKGYLNLSNIFVFIINIKIAPRIDF